MTAIAVSTRCHIITIVTSVRFVITVSMEYVVAAVNMWMSAHL
jgi:hypothetical protein